MENWAHERGGKTNDGFTNRHASQHNKASTPQNPRDAHDHFTHEYKRENEQGGSPFARAWLQRVRDPWLVERKRGALVWEICEK
jgi:hypothetical protein